MKKSKFNTDYSQRIRQIIVTEDDSVWDEIQDELDFIESWDKISAKLDKINPPAGKAVSIKYREVLIAAAALILIIFLPFRLPDEQANKPSFSTELIIETDNAKELTPNESKSATAVKEKPATITEVSPAKNSTEELPAKLADNRTVTVTESTKAEAEDTVFSKEEITVSEINNIPLNTDIFLSRNNDIALNTIQAELNTVSEPAERPNFSVRIADAGLMYAYKNTWLLNYETRNGLNPEKLGETLPTFHQDIGVSTTLAFNNQHLFGLEFFWKSKAGQNYRQYINASFVEKNINLNYLKLQAYYIRNFQNVPGEAIFGAYIASLTMAEEKREKTKFNMNNSYSDHDFGLLAGYQFNIAFGNRITIKPGLRLNYNLVNIFKGDDITPGYLKNTKNFAASLNLSLSYRF